MKQVAICNCNNCYQTYIDTNPSENSKTIADTGSLKSLVLLLDDRGTYRGCPECKTDEYLIDILKDK